MTEVQVHDKTIEVSCGPGTQRIKWLGHVGIARYDGEEYQGWKSLGELAASHPTVTPPGSSGAPPSQAYPRGSRRCPQLVIAADDECGSCAEVTAGGQRNELPGASAHGGGHQGELGERGHCESRHLAHTYVQSHACPFLCPDMPHRPLRFATSAAKN